MKQNGTPDNYQFKPFHYSSHYWICQFISERRQTLRILDVGTAAGYLGSALKEQGHFVVGVERDRQLAGAAQRIYDEIYTVDVEAYEFPFKETFDVILFADILEHTRDPMAILRRALPALKKDGEVIVSVPNIAHLAIRLSVLCGRFNYADRGILDRTHLRFFTRKTCLQLLLDSGFTVDAIVPTPVPLQLVFPATETQWFTPFHLLHYWFVRRLQGLLAFQFVVRARPRSE